jgi:hypothetical protein
VQTVPARSALARSASAAARSRAEYPLPSMRNLPCTSPPHLGPLASQARVTKRTSRQELQAGRPLVRYRVRLLRSQTGNRRFASVWSPRRDLASPHSGRLDRYCQCPARRVA